MSLTIDTPKLNYNLFTGPTGVQGFLGFNGFQGSIGDIGSLTIGITGPTGPNGGLNVVIGPTGYNGGEVIGMRGLQGYQGVQGRGGNYENGAIANGMIYNDKLNVNMIQTDMIPIYNEIRSRISGSNICTIEDERIWNGSIMDNMDAYVDGNFGDVIGFKIVSAYSGIYWFSYNLTIRNTDINDRKLLIHCRVGGTNVIPGSLSRITLKGNTAIESICSVSQKFMYVATSGDEIGIYIANDNFDGICIEMDNSNFVAKLVALD